MQYSQSPLSSPSQPIPIVQHPAARDTTPSQQTTGRQLSLVFAQAIKQCELCDKLPLATIHVAEPSNVPGAGHANGLRIEIVSMAMSERMDPPVTACTRIRLAATGSIVTDARRQASLSDVCCSPLSDQTDSQPSSVPIAAISMLRLPILLPYM